MKEHKITKIQNTPIEQLFLQLPISPLLKKKAKYDQVDNQDIDFVKQLQGFGLETVIAEQNTSEEELTSHYNNFNVSTNSHMDTFKATTEFDHDHILDYSNLNNKFEKSNRTNQLEQIKKVYSALQLVLKQLESPKYIISKIREGITNLAEQTKKQVSRVKQQIIRKTETILFDLQSQLNFTKLKNKEYQQDIHDLVNKLEEKQSYIAILEIERESSIKKSVQAQKYKNMSQLTQITQSKSQMFELRNRIANLEREKAELKQEMRSKEDKNIYSKNMLVNSITSQQLDLKHKYIMMLEKFSNQFEKVSEEVEERKMREIQNNNNLYQWEVQLIHQQEEINDIIGNLQEREESIMRRESFLREKEAELSLKEKQLYQAFQRQERSYSQHFLLNQKNPRAPQNSEKEQRSPDNYSSNTRQKNRNFLKSFNHRVPTQTKSSACLIKAQNKGTSKHRYTQYGKKDCYGQDKAQILQNRRNYPKREMRNLTGRIDQLQISLQKELVALERRY